MAIPTPPKTLYMLCVGLLRFLRENGVHMNFLDEKDCRFNEFRRPLSARMTELTMEGIRTTTKQAEGSARKQRTFFGRKVYLEMAVQRLF